jgi:hypothetical protein
MRLGRALSLFIAIGFFTLGPSAASAVAAPIWFLDIHHAPTNFPPGTPGTTDATTSTEGSPPATNEIQRILVRATSGQFKLSFGGDTTPNLPFDASAGDVQSALRALPAIGGPSVDVEGGPQAGISEDDRRYVVIFTGALAATDVQQITVANGTTPLRRTVELWFDLYNVGDVGSSGPITLTIDLPNGVKRDSVRLSNDDWGPGADLPGPDLTGVSCPGSPGQQTVTCTLSGTIRRHAAYRGLVLGVHVDANVSGERIATATVSGGGGAASANSTELLTISPNPTPFGIIPDSFRPEFFGADYSTVVRQAGAHPAVFTVPFNPNLIAWPFGFAPQQSNVAGKLRNLEVDLPPGFLGDPTAVGECSEAQFDADVCPPSSQVGVLDLRLYPVTSLPEWISSPISASVYNLAHPRGAISDLAIALEGGQAVHIKAFLDPANNYAIKTKVGDINETLPVFQQRLTIWGTPAHPRHDRERCRGANLRQGMPDGDPGCPAGIPPKPFLTVPFECDTEHQMRLHSYDSWENSGIFGPDIAHTFPGQFTGCDLAQAEFDPDVSIVPTNTRADSPTGLNVTASIPFNADPDGIATPPVKRFEVTLPRGMATNPSFADGLEGCTEAQIGISHAGVPDMSPVTCPDQARIGSVDLSTPLLPDAPADHPRCEGPAPLQGSIYLAKQQANPLDALFAIYTVVEDCEDRGIIVKLPGSMELDPPTGQITTVFDDLPQFPFDSLSVKFRGGDRAPLINPPTCGTKTIEGELTTRVAPDTEIAVDSSYAITEGPDGDPCSPDLRSRPFAPQMKAGTQDPVAARYSPFVLRLTRKDGEQELTSLQADLARGLSGKLAGVARCPEETIASIPTAPGNGAAEKANPSCPAASKVGRINAGSGAGLLPFYIGGSVYLTGPYKGAPVSVAVITPAVAGGIDLGNVIVRTALHVDSDDAQIHAVSDPLPTILHGVPIHLRDLRVVMDRPNFTLNPTSCEEKAVSGQAGGAGALLADPADDTSAALSDRFQVGGCAGLGFAPKLTLKLRGGTKRGAHPALSAILTPRPGDANIASISVAFPKSEFLEQAHIRTVCTRADFAASTCPAGAIYGRATATTPLFDFPLAANVYLRSSDNLLPDVVPDFRGPPSLPIKIESAGRVDSIHGGIRNTFDFIPDAPITRVLFALQGGKKGLLVNSRDICKHTYRATVKYGAHNGDTYTERPKLVAGCAKKRKRKGKRRGHRRDKRAVLSQGAVRVR